jgi:hypothetical protein
MEDILPELIPSRAFQVFLYTHEYVLGIGIIMSI